MASEPVTPLNFINDPSERVPALAELGGVCEPVIVCVPSDSEEKPVNSGKHLQRTDKALSRYSEERHVWPREHLREGRCSWTPGSISMIVTRQVRARLGATKRLSSNPILSSVLERHELID